jgi:hypothetical protein
VGYSADLLVVHGDPRSDLTALERPALVMTGDARTSHHLTEVRVGFSMRPGCLSEASELPGRTGPIVDCLP